MCDRLALQAEVSLGRGQFRLPLLTRGCSFRALVSAVVEEVEVEQPGVGRRVEIRPEETERRKAVRGLVEVADPALRDLRGLLNPEPPAGLAQTVFYARQAVALGCAPGSRCRGTRRDSFLASTSTGPRFAPPLSRAMAMASHFCERPGQYALPAVPSAGRCAQWRRALCRRGIRAAGGPTRTTGRKAASAESSLFAPAARSMGSASSTLASSTGRRSGGVDVELDLALGAPVGAVLLVVF